MTQFNIVEEFQRVKELAGETGDYRVMQFVLSVEKIVVTPAAEQTGVMAVDAFYKVEDLSFTIKEEDERHSYFLRWDYDVRRMIKELLRIGATRNFVEINHQRMAVMVTTYDRVLHYR